MDQSISPSSILHPPSSKARYIMIGGFLGAGKTTSVAKLARRLTDQGLRVGLITNDQGEQLVDTAMLASHGFAVEEIPGGCFCCRFSSLVEAAQKLTAATTPDIFIAEPVGSCTDLVATVSYPLRRIYGNDFSIAPLSVLLDPVRALRILGVETGDRFSPKVAYIYRKQIEEADVLVINKCDAIEPSRVAALRAALHRQFPRAEIFEVSARSGAGLEPWFERILCTEQSSIAAIEMDYETYAEGEAQLGWLNATLRVKSEQEIDGNTLLSRLAEELQSRLTAAHAEIAHLKMTLSPDEGLGDIAAINLVRNDFVPELSQSLDEPLTCGELILNLRAEAAPEVLRDAVAAASIAVAQNGVELAIEHLEHFRPGKPQPQHRDA